MFLLLPPTEEDTIQNDTATRANFTKRLEEKVENLRKRFQTLELEQMRKGELEARKKLEKAQEAVSEKREEVRKRLDRARRASSDAWDDAREGLESAWTELQEAVARAREDFEEKRKED